LDGDKLLEPVLNFNDGYEKGFKPFMEIARQIGFSAKTGRLAFEYALQKQREYWQAAVKLGEKALNEAEKENRTLIVILGRPYNAFSEMANMGIPRKFSSRGYSVLPMDFLPISDQSISPNMYWFYGQQNLKATVICKARANLFPCYISNFSCAPDSFILHQVRWLMGSKPFLILELDSHSADAGIDTRIEAFLDIIEGYKSKLKQIKDKPYKMKYSVVFQGQYTHVVNNFTGEKISLQDPRVTILIPSMGHFAARVIGETMRFNGIKAINLPVADNQTVQLARNVASGKECIPTLLTLGSTLKFFMSQKINRDDIYLALCAKTTGPCRTGQYGPFYTRIYDQIGFDNIVTMDLSSDNSYTELGPSASKMAWVVFVISDYIKDIETSLNILALDKKAAAREMEIIKEYILASIAGGIKNILKTVKQAARDISAIPKEGSVDGLKKVLVVGEIFVRGDDFSQEELVQILGQQRIMAKLANLTEWVHYTDFVRKHRLRDRIRKIPLYRRYFSKPYKKLQYILLEEWWKHRMEKKVLDALMPTGLVPVAPHNMQRIMRHAKRFTSVEFETESTISTCVAVEAMNYGYDGVVAIAPFACLIGRLIKSLLNPYFRSQEFPYMALENDGQAYPPNMINQLEMFILNVLRYDKHQKKISVQRDVIPENKLNKSMS
jgi:predicted nucleotide-binding protein (sugar kinase/HSP70/actin superfamily)